jgi:glutathione synthase/RimK-type ligase-like ATP-grasp enzyme
MYASPRARTHRCRGRGECACRRRGGRQRGVSEPVFLAVDAATADLTADDRVLAEAIGAAGSEVVPVIWGARTPRHGTVVIRSTWDYVNDPNRFSAWLGELDADDVAVYNPTKLLRWNMHKRYMVELRQRGVPIVPTVVVRQQQRVDLDELMRSHGWDDAVIKPAIGATARLALHVGAGGPAAAQRHLDEMLAREDALVQRFVPSVWSSGEMSVIAIGGVITHAVQKRAAAGDWRVQAEFGGSVELVAVGEELAAAARRVLAAVQPTPLYARVDLVAATSGELQVIELELVEPELFFRLAPHAATRMAELLVHGTP